MDSSNNEVICDGKGTFFSSHAEFPDLIEDKIDTCKFLEASKGVVELIERLGKGFAIIRRDVQGNVEKLRKKYLTNPKKFQSLTDMILYEQSEGGKVIRDALLWLKRALFFIETFLGYIIEDFNHSDSNEEIALFLKKAYDVTLRPHHNWITRKLFIVVVSIAPSRSQMFSLLANGNEEMDRKIIVQAMEDFVSRLRVNLQQIDKFYLDNSFE